MRRDFRDLIAARVTESWTTIPHFFVTREIAAEGLEGRLARERERGGAETRPTATDLILEALARAIGPSDASAAVDLGLAVASASGVMIPVIRDLLDGDLATLSAKRVAAVERGRSGRLSAADLEEPPSTTLSNLGPFGVDQFTGVIPLEQPSMLTIGRIARRFAPDPESGEPQLQSFFMATLNADHRVLDGSDAARILAVFAEEIEAGARSERGGG